MKQQPTTAVRRLLDLGLLGAVFAAFLAAILVVRTAEADDAPTESSPAAAAFARLRALEGTWRAESDGYTAYATYASTGNGTAVTEHYRREGDDAHDMLTVYHLDGDRLLLTHYCMANNQPRMLAELDPASPDTITFEFLDATNLASPDDGHMHRAVFELLDDDRMNQQWTFFEGGKPVFSEVAHYERVR